MATHCGLCDGSGADVCGRYGQARMTDARRVEILRRALRVIHTWATCDDGAWLDPGDLARLTEQALEQTGQAPRRDPCSRR